MNNKKLFITILGVLFAAVLITGITFAGWEWASGSGNDTNITFTTEKGFSCSADGGGNITEADIKLVPTTCDNSEYAIKRTITANVTTSRSSLIYFNLWLDIKKLSQGLSDSNNFSYAVTDSPDGCTEGNVYSKGTFTGKSVNDKVDIINDSYASTGNKTYYLYIWLDYEGIDRTSQNEEFDLELGGECRDEPPSPNPPYIENSGLIPIKLSDTGDTVTTVAENDSTWYNYSYSQKKWANAILVNEDTHTRTYYKNNPGTIVPQEDILAYYVWIPRYSYKVWQYTGVSSTGSEQEIEIKFIGTDTIETATQNGEWYTHPAFWWDDNSDGVRDSGEELSGIWVGKFETSHETLSSSTTNNNLGTDSGTICNSTGCNNYAGLRVLPNVQSLKYNRLSNYFNASRFMESSGNPFGLEGDTVDSHMMKNREWGAIAYLSHSKYGINGPVRKNDNSNMITGCGALVANAGISTDCNNAYGIVSLYPQSTTGNVTGVFDMSGGVYEYVMGHWGGTNVYSPSNATDYTASGFSATYPLPEKKYYDNYPSSQFNGNVSTNINNCTLEFCGGHALNETYSWYNSNGGDFIYSDKPWFGRGSGYNWSGSGGYSSTIFNISSGNYTHFSTFRLVLIENID